MTPAAEQSALSAYRDAIAAAEREAARVRAQQRRALAEVVAARDGAALLTAARNLRALDASADGACPHDRLEDGQAGIVGCCAPAGAPC